MAKNDLPTSCIICGTLLTVERLLSECQQFSNGIIDVNISHNSDALLGPNP